MFRRCDRGDNVQRLAKGALIDKCSNTITVQRTPYLLRVCNSSTGVVQILDEISFWSNRIYQELIQAKQRVGS